MLHGAREPVPGGVEEQVPVGVQVPVGEMLDQVRHVNQGRHPGAIYGDLRMNQQRGNIELDIVAFSHKDAAAPVACALQC